MRFGIPDQTLDRIIELFRKYNSVEEVIIYGSRAKGNYREGSDIDITVKGNNITTELIFSLKNDIDLLNTPYLFDISVYNELKSEELKEHINRVGAILYLRE